MEGQNKEQGRSSSIDQDRAKKDVLEQSTDPSKLRDPSEKQPLAEINNSVIGEQGSKQTIESGPKEANQRSASDSDVASEYGTPEEAFKAATHGTDQAKPGHPGHAEHAREPTGRHADETWKHQES